MADTPWGALPVSDAHVHFFSHRFYLGLAQQKALNQAEDITSLLGWNAPPVDPAELATRWVEELDRYDVARACLIGSAHGDEESVSAAVAANPSRFFGYFMLDPLAPDALVRMDAATANPHLHCVCLFPAMHGFSILDARLDPLLHLAASRCLSVFVHCGAPSVGVRTKLELSSSFDLRFSNPLDLHAVALRFPDIRFVIPHFGAGMFRETLMVADLCPNIWLDTSSTNRWMNYEALDLRDVFRRTIAVVGIERLLFGTDSSFFPRGWHGLVLQKQAQAMYEIGLSQGDAAQVLRWNLERFHDRRASNFGAEASAGAPPADALGLAAGPE